MFPPVPESMIDDGYRDFADRWNPILDVFDEVGVRFAHEVHPSEIAYDYWTAVRALEAVGRREAFGLNWDPSHFVWQDLDPVGFLWDFRDRIYHVDCKDAKRQVGNGRNGRMGSHLPWADPRRGWDFVSTGHGDVPWEACFRMLNTIGYDGPISIEWEDAGMDRLVGAPDALAFVRRTAFDPPGGGLRRGVQQRQLIPPPPRESLQSGARVATSGARVATEWRASRYRLARECAPSGRPTRRGTGGPRDGRPWPCWASGSWARAWPATWLGAGLDVTVWNRSPDRPGRSPTTGDRGRRRRRCGRGSGRRRDDALRRRRDRAGHEACAGARPGGGGVGADGDHRPR